MATHAWLRDVASRIQPSSARLLPPALPCAPGKAWELVASVIGVTEARLAEIAADHLGVPIAVTPGDSIDPAQFLSPQLASHYRVLPLGVQGHVLQLATSDPANEAVFEEIRFVTGRKVSLHLQSPEWIAQESVRLYGAAPRARSPISLWAELFGQR